MIVVQKARQKCINCLQLWTYSDICDSSVLVREESILYGPASAIGVYLVGSRGKQTGSFLLTLVAGFLGGCVMLPTLFVTGSVLGGACLALVFLTAPVIATIGFNGTRRYKEPPSS